jgi:hypothetical protein
MALGKEINEFSGKSTSVTIGPGPGNALTFQANIEGTLSGERGEATYALTQHAEGEMGAKSGTWTMYGVMTLKDGESMGFRGQGTWDEISSGKWRYQGTGTAADGTPYAYEFEGDWATRTWAGKSFKT